MCIYFRPGKTLSIIMLRSKFIFSLLCFSPANSSLVAWPLLNAHLPAVYGPRVFEALAP